MASVTHTAAAIDDSLDYLTDEWSRLTTVQQRWPQTDAIEREVFHLEWAGVIEPRLHELAAWAAEGELSVEQLGRFAHLLELVRRYRPFINEVYAET